MRHPARPLTEEAFRPFGTVLTHPAAAARTPIIPVLANRRDAARVTLGLIRYDGGPGPVSFSTVERHPLSEQLFLNLGGVLLVAVMPDLDEGGSGPDPDRVEAFVCGPQQSFLYHPGTWHAPLSALGGPATVASLLSRDGGDADVETVSLPHPIEVFLE